MMQVFICSQNDSNFQCELGCKCTNKFLGYGKGFLGKFSLQLLISFIN